MNDTIQAINVDVYRIATDRPEADGTYRWDATTVLLVEAVAASGVTGLGFSYTSAAAATLIRENLAEQVIGTAVSDVTRAWDAMLHSVRNAGRPGIAATAMAAVDIALWDLKARQLGQPLYKLLGARRASVPVYGSGGFTSYSEAELVEQFTGWVSQGIRRVKMKVGKDWATRAAQDLERVRIAREAIGPETALFVDANGAYTPKQAVQMAHRFANYGVTYFEEPVSSDHLEQMAFVRQHAPMDIAAGEYGYDTWYFRDMLRAGAVDILQADVTRCMGITGWLDAAALAYAFAVPLSAHTAPAIHAHLGCTAPWMAHVEYFHDHARIEKMLFDGFPALVDGNLQPDPERPGLGLVFKRQEAERWRVES
jgi:L-alanine-DL-glutamate epimerase-like enolase superfamily enzyme